MDHKIWVYGIKHMFWSKGAMSRGMTPVFQIRDWESEKGNGRTGTTHLVFSFSGVFLGGDRRLDGVVLEIQVRIGLWPPGPGSLTSLLQTVT